RIGRRPGAPRTHPVTPPVLARGMVPPHPRARGQPARRRPRSGPPHLPLPSPAMKFRTTLLTLLTAALLAACAHAPQPAAGAAPPVKLAMSQTERGVMIWLPDNVLFDFGKADLSAASGAYLDRVADILNHKTDHSLSLEGHTDNVGSVAFNQKLSEDRAAAVARALIQRGVAAARLKTVGYGFSRPLAPNDTETGRRLNRRVEIIVLGETVAHLSAGEPANAFEDAFAHVKAEMEKQLDAGKAE
ncbi:MAG: OmpA family protein, partial [Burkholderiales bacterium]|nr:OmpA family protein [Burkholderiales bacterium]